MICPRVVRQCVKLCVVGLVVTFLDSPAVALWRSVDDNGFVVDIEAPGLSPQTRRDSPRIDDMLNAKSIRSCWGAPGTGTASACITYQAILSAIGKFPYLRATNVATNSEPLRSIAKQVAKTNQTVATANAEFEVARFTTFSGDFQQDCFSLARYWDARRKRIIGWYCAETNVTLDDAATRDIIATITFGP